MAGSQGAGSEFLRDNSGELVFEGSDIWKEFGRARRLSGGRFCIEVKHGNSLMRCSRHFRAGTTGARSATSNLVGKQTFARLFALLDGCSLSDS